MSSWDEAEVDRAPICPSCGVTALPAEGASSDDAGFVCENPACEAYGEAIES